MDPWFMKNCDDDDYLDWSDDDDVCTSRKCLSSDEEDDHVSVFHKAGKLKKKSGACVRVQDEFEREMASELSATMTALTRRLAPPGPATAPVTTGPATTDTQDPEFYDDVYFDSDDSDVEGAASQPSSGRKGRRVLSNDELLYDPTMDDQDQLWVDAKRRSYQLKAKRKLVGGPSTGAQPLPQSDAVLNCPACLTTLCHDCQRHEIYQNQYRAMFVFNCVIDRTEGLKFPNKNLKKKEFMKNKKKNKKLRSENHVDENRAGGSGEGERSGGDGQASGGGDAAMVEAKESGGAAAIPFTAKTNGDDQVFHPVKCEICNTKVAVYDKDEVYHFFNVVTSY